MSFPPVRRPPPSVPIHRARPLFHRLSPIPADDESADSDDDVSRETGLRPPFGVPTAADLAVVVTDFDETHSAGPGGPAQRPGPGRRGLPAADAPARGDPRLRGREPEGRRRQDHLHGEHRGRTGPARPARPGDRPRPSRERLHRAERRASPRRPVHLRRARRRRPPGRPGAGVPRRRGPVRGAGDHRPGRCGDRAGQRGRSRGPAEEGRCRPPAGGRAERGGGGPLRLRADRLPAVAGAAHRERAGRRATR